MSVSQKELLDAVVQAGLLDRRSVDDIRRVARNDGLDVVDMVASRGRFPRSALWRALAQVQDMAFVGSAELSGCPNLIARMPSSLLDRRACLPLEKDDSGEVLVAVDGPVDNGFARIAERTFGATPRFVLAEARELAQAIRRDVPQAGATLTETASDPIAALDDLLRETFLTRASDLHIEAEEAGYRVRMRVDGALMEVSSNIDRTVGQGIVSRVKVLAGLDIAESRAPQDGAWRHPIGADRTLRAARTDLDENTSIDMRVATVPTIHGEKLTLRILPRATDFVSLEQLGLSEDDLHSFRGQIARPHGLFVITGPTGSGKSTTLYAALEEIKDVALNIMTVEDPVERPLAGVSQVRVDGVGKVGFQNALRSLLRHDPDVMMIGEIRDGEGASIALRAASTGHLVFTTLHTNDAPSAVARLRDLGGERFQIASTLIGVMGQRLVRRLCTSCRQPRAVTEMERQRYGDRLGEETYEPGSCARCLGTGFAGRIGIFEMLEVTDRLREEIAAGDDEKGLRRHLADACRPLWRDGFAKVRHGVTSLSELIRVATIPHQLDGSDA